jgi:citrate synthase
MPSMETSLSTYDAKSITYRGHDLTEELMGELDFGGTALLLITGEYPSEGETRVANAMLSSLMVHGVTAHAISARLTYLSEPQSIQGAVASGILGVGSQFVGSMEECAEVLQEVDDADDPEAAAEDVVATYREAGEPFPGIGHPFHEPVDPRAERLFTIADEEDVAGPHIEHLRAIQNVFKDATGKRLIVNVTGAIAAVSSDIGLSPTTARGLAVVSRAAGLVAEVVEEQASPNAYQIWDLIEEETTYVGDEAERPNSDVVDEGE